MEGEAFEGEGPGSEGRKGRFKGEVLIGTRGRDLSPRWRVKAEIEDEAERDLLFFRVETVAEIW